jgi:cell division protein FtsL
MSSRPSRAARKSPPHLRVVRRKSRKLIVRHPSRRAAPYVIGGAILVLGIVFTVLLEQVVLAQSAFKLAEVRARLVAAETRHHELLLQTAELESTDRIERFARDQLGMVDSDPVSANYIYADIARHAAVPGGQRLVEGESQNAGAAIGTSGELAP